MGQRRTMEATAQTVTVVWQRDDAKAPIPGFHGIHAYLLAPWTADCDLTFMD